MGGTHITSIKKCSGEYIIHYQAGKLESYDVLDNFVISRPTCNHVLFGY